MYVIVKFKTLYKHIQKSIPVLLTLRDAGCIGAYIYTHSNDVSK